ncbi:MAG: DUF917 domain-containing protein [Erythrobacter sp.]
MIIGSDDLDALALGSVFLATGGGGDPYIPKLITARALDEYGPANVIAPTDLGDDAFVCAIGSVGAPTVSLELLPSIDEAAGALAAFEERMGRTVDAIAAFEIGGGNSLIPLLAAASRNIPMLDGDGMARALPEAQMMTYAMAGIPSTPSVSYDYLGKVRHFDCPDPLEYEGIIRACAVESGGMITAVEHPMSGVQCKEAIIPGTLSFALKLGRLLERNRGPAHAIAQPLADLFEGTIYGACKMVYSGKVSAKSSRVVGGYDVGEAVVESADAGVAPMTITIKNEYLLASMGDYIVASVPDLIVIVDAETSTPINAERLRYGQRVAVFAIGAPAAFQTPEALTVVGPRYFGFEHDYVPFTG